MPELHLVKTPAGALIPSDGPTAAYLQKLKTGQGVHGQFKKERNPRLHRKVFALLQLAFEAWDAPALEYKGHPVAKNFDRFRRDITILAGHYEATTNIKGEIRLEAKSLSFASMDDAEFEEVYKGLLGVVWDRVLQSKGYGSAAEVDRVVAELLRFDG